MSWRVSRHVWDHTRVTGLTRYVLVALADRANTRGRAWPSLADLVRRTGLCRRTVIKCIAEARRQGELLVEHTGRHNTYEIPAGDRCTLCTSPSDASGARGACRGAPDAPRGAPHAPGTDHEPTKNHHAPAARRRFTAAKRQRGRSLRSPGAGSSDPTPDRPVRPSPQTDPSDQTTRPDSRIPALIGTFVRLHRETLDQPYPPAWARDGACMKRALKTWEPADIEKAMTVYFTDRDARLQFGADVPAFVKRIPTLLARTLADTTRGFVG